MAGIEHSLTISNEFSPFNVVCAVKIEGRLDMERLRKAVAALQRRHRQLRTRIVPEKGSYFFAYDNVGPGTVVSAERKSPEGWIAVVEEELDRRMDITAGPLLRCCFLQNSTEPGGESEIILTFNHAILDASPGLHLLSEFIRACTEEQVDLEPEVADEGIVPARSLFPPKLSGFGFSGLHAFTTNMTIGPEYSALARLFKGEIWLDCLYIDSDMDIEKARHIADEIRLILEGAVSLADPV